MNGMKPKFLEGIAVSERYHAMPDPSRSPDPAGVDLLAMSRYAKRIGKRMIDLSKEEVDTFAANR